MKYKSMESKEQTDYQTKLRSFASNSKKPHRSSLNKVYKRGTPDFEGRNRIFSSSTDQNLESDSSKGREKLTQVKQRNKKRKHLSIQYEESQSKSGQVSEEQPSLSTAQILENITQKCERVYAEAATCKYFSRNIYRKITDDADFSKLNLKQDQKKSLECNLIYNILKYLSWSSIFTYLKKNRQKVKILKVSTFREYIINGKLFENEPDPKAYSINDEMIQNAVFKLKNLGNLYSELFNKKVYTKLFSHDVEKYKEKMIVFVYKIIQFTELMKKELERIWQNRQQSTTLDINEILKEGEARAMRDTNAKVETLGGSLAASSNTFFAESNYIEEQVQLTPLRLSTMFLDPNSPMQSFSFEREQTELQKNSILTPDIDQDIDQSSKKNLPAYQIDNP